MKEWSPAGKTETTGKQKLPAVVLHEVDEQREGCVRKGGEGLTPERVLLSPEGMDRKAEQVAGGRRTPATVADACCRASKFAAGRSPEGSYSTPEVGKGWKEDGK